MEDIKRKNNTCIIESWWKKEKWRSRRYWITLDHIASYANRIKDMLLIANTLYKNDISVSRFVASREKHTLGFIYNKDSEYPYCGIHIVLSECWIRDMIGMIVIN